MSKKKQSYLERTKQHNQMNKKAIIGVSAVFVALVILMTVLLILHR